MFGLKTLLLFSMFNINVLVNGYQGKMSLDDLLERVLDRLKGQRDEHARQGSWDDYIDNLIAQSKDDSGTPHVDKACIIGVDGGAKWTTDEHPNALKLSSAERTSIAKVFKSKNLNPFVTNGVNAEGIKYQFLRQEDQKLLLAKKDGYGALTLHRSKTAIVIAHNPEGKQQGLAKKAVNVIVEYLVGIGM